MFVEINFQLNGKENIKVSDVKDVVSSIGCDVISKHETVIDDFIRSQIVAKIRINYTSFFLLENWEAYAVSFDVIEAYKDLKILVDRLYSKDLLADTKVEIYDRVKHFTEDDKFKYENKKIFIQMISGILLSLFSFILNPTSLESVVWYICSVIIYIVFLYFVSLTSLEKFKERRLIKRYGWSLIN
jgi:hypothetical protein